MNMGPVQKQAEILRDWKFEQESHIGFDPDLVEFVKKVPSGNTLWKYGGKIYGENTFDIGVRYRILQLSHELEDL
jgi:hypothetical protein